MNKKKKDKHILLGNEKYTGQLTDIDRKILQAAETGEGTIPLTPEKFAEMAEKAGKVYDKFKVMIKPMINKERAALVKYLRLTLEYSWRSIAVRCWTEWGGKWQPATNQIAGIVICELASEILGEKID